MEVSGDELAGIVELFGAMTREELRQACAELAFRAGEDDPESVADAVEAAVESLALVAYEDDGRELLAPGPAALPTLPDGAPDLPHVLDVERRSVDRGLLVEEVEVRLEAATAAAVESGDSDRAAALTDLTYDAEAWGNLELAELRARLQDV